MTKKYSKSTGGFYDSEIHGSFPADAVEISADTYAALMDAQGKGQQIVADSKGRPVAADRGPGTEAEQAEGARLVRNAKLMATDWTQAADVQASMENTMKQAWASYRQALRDIPKQTGFPTAIDWPVSP